MTPLMIVWTVAFGFSAFALYKERTLTSAALLVVTLLLFLGAAGVTR